MRYKPDDGGAEFQANFRDVLELMLLLFKPRCLVHRKEHLKLTYVGQTEDDPDFLYFYCPKCQREYKLQVIWQVTEIPKGR